MNYDYVTRPLRKVAKCPHQMANIVLRYISQILPLTFMALTLALWLFSLSDI